MKGALIILAITVATGLVLYIFHKIGEKKEAKKNEGKIIKTTPIENNSEPEEGCCGMHIICEKDSLLSGVSSKIEYYDDEDLDQYAGFDADSYTDEQIEEFRDVLFTLLPEDIAGWARSLQLRGITLPAIVKDELLLIVQEERARLDNAAKN